MFQSNIRARQTTGIQGEFVKDGPIRSNDRMLKSTDPANNVIGRVVQQIAAEDHNVSADIGTVGICAGIIGIPKSYSSAGTTGDTLAATMTLPNNTEIECLLEGTIFAPVENDGAGNAIGNILFYDVSTGVITSAPPETEAPDGSALIPNGRVANHSTAGGSLTEIYINIQG